MLGADEPVEQLNLAPSVSLPGPLLKRGFFFYARRRAEDSLNLVLFRYKSYAQKRRQREEKENDAAG